MSQTLFLLYRPEPARPMSKAKSVGAHSICARGGLSCRKRARADMESAPTFFVAGGVPSQRRCPARRFLPLLKAKSVGAHSICARDTPAEVCLAASGHGRIWNPPLRFLRRAEPPRRGRCPAWSCLPLLKTKSVGAHSICARGGLSYRKRARADMESAPTFFCRGGQGARFCLLCVQADLFPLAPCQKPSYVVYYFSTSPQANPVQTGDAKL